MAHNLLAFYLIAMEKFEEATAECREAIRQRKGFFDAHLNLSAALLRTGQLTEAIVEARKAIQLDPGSAEAHCNLGAALKETGQVDLAAGEFRKAIQLDENVPEPYCNLGQILAQQGRFMEAAKALRRGHEVGSRHANWPREQSAKALREAEDFARLDEQLPAVLAGKVRGKDALEWFGFARLCQLYRKRFAASARFYSEAFADQPDMAADLQASHRYDAACAAALAGCGQGEDAATLGETVRIRWRRQALTWLAADLRAWTRLLAKEPQKAGPTVVKQLRHWLTDPDFAGVRAPEALAKLPAEERQAWQRLWADVSAVLAEAGGKPKGN